MNAKIEKYPEETIIVREGESNTDMFKIVSGHAEVYVGFGKGLRFHAERYADRE